MSVRSDVSHFMTMCYSTSRIFPRIYTKSTIFEIIVKEGHGINVLNCFLQWNLEVTRGSYRGPNLNRKAERKQCNSENGCKDLWKLSLNKGKTIHTILGREFEGGVKTRGNFAKWNSFSTGGPWTTLLTEQKFLYLLTVTNIRIGWSAYFPEFLSVFLHITSKNIQRRS